jgi:hypothetical protein
MGLFGQLAIGLSAPLALIKVRWRAACLALVYLAACAGILWLIGSFFVRHEGDAIDLAATYLFPESWRFAAHELIKRFFATQTRDVLVNAIIGGSLVVVQLALFWLKEIVSSAFEKESKLTTSPQRELPLWQQALEEVELLLLFLAVQTSLIWLGYPPDPTRRLAASILSYLFLFASFGIDFLSPLLQRHDLRYSTILKTLLFRRPFLVLAFGAIFTLPTILAAQWAAAHPEWTLAKRITLVFGANVVTIAWAALAGTCVASRLLGEAKTTKPPWWITRFLFQAVVIVALVWNSYRLGAVGLALHHKSQILKCNYDVDWTSIGIDKPSVMDLLKDKVSVGVHLDLTIENPTSFDVELEENRLEVRHKDVLVATAKLTPVEIPSKGKVKTEMRFPIELTPSALRAGTELLERKDWSITLFVEVAPGYEFPIYLVTPAR